MNEAQKSGVSENNNDRVQQILAKIESQGSTGGISPDDLFAVISSGKAELDPKKGEMRIGNSIYPGVALKLKEAGYVLDTLVVNAQQVDSEEVSVSLTPELERAVIEAHKGNDQALRKVRDRVAGTIGKPYKPQPADLTALLLGGLAERTKEGDLTIYNGNKRIMGGSSIIKDAGYDDPALIRLSKHLRLIDKPEINSDESPKTILELANMRLEVPVREKAEVSEGDVDRARRLLKKALTVKERLAEALEAWTLAVMQQSGGGDAIDARDYVNIFADREEQTKKEIEAKEKRGILKRVLGKVRDVFSKMGIPSLKDIWTSIKNKFKKSDNDGFKSSVKWDKPAIGQRAKLQKEIDNLDGKKGRKLKRAEQAMEDYNASNPPLKDRINELRDRAGEGARLAISKMIDLVKSTSNYRFFMDTDFSDWREQLPKTRYRPGGDQTKNEAIERARRLMDQLAADKQSGESPNSPEVLSRIQSLRTALETINVDLRTEKSRSQKDSSVVEVQTEENPAEKNLVVGSDEWKERAQSYKNSIDSSRKYSTPKNPKAGFKLPSWDRSNSQEKADLERLDELEAERDSGRVKVGTPEWVQNVDEVAEIRKRRQEGYKKDQLAEDKQEEPSKREERKQKIAEVNDKIASAKGEVDYYRRTLANKKSIAYNPRNGIKKEVQLELYKRNLSKSEDKLFDLQNQLRDLQFLGGIGKLFDITKNNAEVRRNNRKLRTQEYRDHKKRLKEKKQLLTKIDKIVNDPNKVSELEEAQQQLSKLESQIKERKQQATSWIPRLPDHLMAKLTREEKKKRSYLEERLAKAQENINKLSEDEAYQGEFGEEDLAEVILHEQAQRDLIQANEDLLNFNFEVDVVNSKMTADARTLVGMIVAGAGGISLDILASKLNVHPYTRRLAAGTMAQSWVSVQLLSMFSEYLGNNTTAEKFGVTKALNKLWPNVRRHRKEIGVFIAAYGLSNVIGVGDFAADILLPDADAVQPQVSQPDVQADTSASTTAGESSSIPDPSFDNHTANHSVGVRQPQQPLTGTVETPEPQPVEAPPQLPDDFAESIKPQLAGVGSRVQEGIPAKEGLEAVNGYWVEPNMVHEVKPGDTILGIVNNELGFPPSGAIIGPDGTPVSVNDNILDVARNNFDLLSKNIPQELRDSMLGAINTATNNKGQDDGTPVLERLRQLSPPSGLESVRLESGRPFRNMLDAFWELTGRINPGEKLNVLPSAKG